jgi:hypothetical protein
MKSSCHFLFRNPVTVELNEKPYKLQAGSRYIAKAQTTQKEVLLQTTQKTGHVIGKHCWGVTSLHA